MRPPRANTLSSYGEVLSPSEAIEPILSRPVRSSLLEWLTEIWAEDELTKVGLKPRRRALFHGGPGTGKTTLAHHLAARLGLPLVAVRPDRVIDCWLGSTGRNLGSLFDAARPEPDGEGPVVLFFDEFEALARKRSVGSKNAEREMNNVVDTLLQRIEAHDGFIIAATNLAAELDPAIWRRFDLQIEVEVPGQGERKRILERYLDPFGMAPSELELFAEAFETASPALIRQFCEALKRNIVIGDRLKWEMGRDSVISRILAGVAPHPELGKPRLWALGAADKAVSNMRWPMLSASEAKEAEDISAGEAKSTVVSMRR